jgi:uncharacterized protein (UPF0262 family)
VTKKRQRIAAVTIEGGGVVRYHHPDVERERTVAIYDLVDDNTFRLVGDTSGPYALHLSIVENRLIIDVRTEAGSPLSKVPLPLIPFRKLVKDYFTVCESYYEAIRTAMPSQIEAIDVGRRSLHDEGAERLCRYLVDKIELDLDTARRLFTLICVLHIRS